MAGPGNGSPQWFLSYSSNDRDVIRGIDRFLGTRGIQTFFDRKSLTPGLSWYDEIETALQRAAGVLVFLGPTGLGGVQKRELQLALARQTQTERTGGRFRVIPVLLPRCDREALPGFAALNTWVELANPAEPQELADTLAVVEGPEEPPARSPLCPFRALRAFREEDASLYFGRERDGERLLALVRTHPFVAVVGPSGSGKSSVVQAGLLPRLRLERAPRHTWDAIVFNPGKRPFYNAASSLSRLWLGDNADVPTLVGEAEKIERQILAGETRLVSYVHEAVRHLDHADRLLIVIDQFEELFTQMPDAELRKRFLDAFLGCVREEPCQVVITLRADYYGRAIEMSRDLSTLLEDAQLNLGPMSRDDLRQVIVGPSARAGITFKDDLVDSILGDVERQPGSLPLLEFALTELWNRVPRSQFTYDDYKSVGRASGAISKRADEVLTQLSDLQRQKAQALLTRLVRVSGTEEDGAHARQSLRLDEVDADGRSILEKFAAARLVVFGEGTVEVAHEALIRNWDTLKQWIDADIQFLLWRQRLAVFVAEWERTGNDASALLSGALLEDAQKWQRSRGRSFSARERRFLDAGIRRRAGARFWRLAAAALVLMAAAAVGGYRFWIATDGYQVREVLRETPFSDAYNSTPSAEDRYMETLQGWIGTLARTGRIDQARAELERAGPPIDSCLDATLAAETRALRGSVPPDDVLREVSDWTRNLPFSHTAIQCLGLFPLSASEKRMAIEAVTHEVPMSPNPAYRWVESYPP